MAKHDSPEVLKRFEAELELVNIIARQLRREVGDVLEFDELLSFGREGLLEASRRFEPDRGVPFRKYANYRVRGAMLDGMRSHGSLPRRAHEKARAMRSANTVSEGLSEDAIAALATGLSGTRADERLAEHLGTLATAMALGLAPHGLDDSAHRTLLDDDLSPEEQAERTELMALVRSEIEHLPPAEATLVKRHFLDDIHIDEASAEIGLSKSWGGRILARGVAMLSKRLARRQ